MEPTGNSVLLGSVQGQWKRIAAAAALFSGYQVGETLVPLVIGMVIDRGVATGDSKAIAGWLGVLLAVFVMLSYSYLHGARACRRSLVDAEHAIRMQLTRRVLDHQGGAEAGRMPGSLTSIATSDAERTSYVNGSLAHAIAAIVGLLVAAVALLRISLPLGLLVLLGTPALLWLIHKLGTPLQHRADAEQERAAHASGIAVDLINGLRVLIGMGAQPAAVNRYRATSQESLTARLRATTANAWYDGTILIVNGLFLAVVALVGGRLAATGRISIGELIAAVGLAQFLVDPLHLLGVVNAEFAQGRASAARVASVLAAAPAVGAGTASLPVPLRGELRIRGLTHDTLAGFDLDVEAGEVLGVVATDPADSVALLRCLAREVEPGAGWVELDGVKLTELRPTDVRAALLVADHGATLFEGTVRENVTVAGVLSLEKVLQSSSVDEVADGLPQGLDTPITERGQTLSGGQRQRIALARALAADRQILVLHEPTTAVDTVTEARIAAGIRELRVGLTTVVVTSSPALLATTDRVAVVEAGAVTASGTHAELIRDHEAYRATVLA
jgi:putative ABC transport system ATP-binding protein